MNSKKLLLAKEKLKKFVGKNEVFIMPLLKFLLTFVALTKINSSIGYMTKLTNGAITLVIALAGSFLPVNLTLVILAIIVVAHIYALSFECAILVLVLFLILFLLYFRFSSKDSIAALLVPLSFTFKIPYVLPVSMGLVGTPSSMVSVACGVIVYHVLHYISANADTFSASVSDDSKLGAFKEIADGLLGNKAMIVLAVSFALTVLIVYIIRRLSIKYSWLIAIAAGTLSCFIITLIANSALDADVSIGGAFVGIIISLILNLVLQYFCFDLDYNRTEKVQFEDDEYYYYVKAVPKNTIKLSDNGKRKAKPKTVHERAKESVREPIRESRQAQSVSSDFEEINSGTSEQARARETVRTTAATAAKARTSNKGPLGMSGGRPSPNGKSD